MMLRRSVLGMLAASTALAGPAAWINVGSQKLTTAMPALIEKQTQLISQTIPETRNSYDFGPDVVSLFSPSRI